MAKLLNSLKNLGNKLTGKEIESNKLAAVIEETAENYSGATLVNGKIPASQLPSYVDDVIEGYLYEGAFYEDSEHTTAITGETGKIYVDLTSGNTYRWSGTLFVQIGGGEQPHLYAHKIELESYNENVDMISISIIALNTTNSNITTENDLFSTILVSVNGFILYQTTQEYRIVDTLTRNNGVIRVGYNAINNGEYDLGNIELDNTWGTTITDTVTQIF